MSYLTLPPGAAIADAIEEQRRRQAQGIMKNAGGIVMDDIAAELREAAKLYDRAGVNGSAGADLCSAAAAAAEIERMRAEVERLRAARDQDIDAAAMRIARAWTKYAQWPELGARCTLDTMACGGFLRAMARAALEGEV